MISEPTRRNFLGISLAAGASTLTHAHALGANDDLRVAIVGRAASPGIDVTLYLIGQEACLRRIDKALEFIRIREQG